MDTLPTDTVSQRAAELRALWDSLAPDHAGATYAADPSFTGAPYDAGVLDPGFLEDGLDLLNFLRAVAGLPADLVVDDDLQTRAQHAATLLARIQFLTRSPTKPADMDDPFFALAQEGLSVSNLAFGSGVETFEDAFPLWLSGTPDSDLVNRRWLLNPRMEITALGFVNGYVAVSVLDVSRSPDPDYEYITWPGPRAFPVEFFADEDYWTLSLGPAWNDIVADDVTITITRESDDAQWTLSSADAGGSPGGGVLRCDGPPYRDRSDSDLPPREWIRGDCGRDVPGGGGGSAPGRDSHAAELRRHLLQPGRLKDGRAGIRVSSLTVFVTRHREGPAFPKPTSWLIV